MTDEDFDDVRLVISLSFRGESRLSDIELERILSFDMEWLSPEKAETAVSKLIDSGWLVGERESLHPAFDTRSISTPIGWYPRPSRILEPVQFARIENSEQTPKQATNTATSIKPNNVILPDKTSNDPREKLGNRLKKFISRKTKIPIEEIERRSERKQKALTYASNWLCLALIAREQGLEMEQIVSSLSS